MVPAFVSIYIDTFILYWKNTEIQAGYEYKGSRYSLDLVCKMDRRKLCFSNGNVEINRKVGTVFHLLCQNDGISLPSKPNPWLNRIHILIFSSHFFNADTLQSIMWITKYMDIANYAIPYNLYPNIIRQKRPGRL